MNTENSTSAGALQRLYAAISQFSGARQRVAMKIANDPWAVRGMSISALAAYAGTSENTITRVTLALGYAGYREFAQELALDLGKTTAYGHVDPSAVIQTEDGAYPASDQSVVHRVIGLEISGLQDTYRHLDDALLGEIVDVLASAESIALIGTGTAAGICQILAYRLLSVGIPASATSDPMAMLAAVHGMHSEHVVILVSFSGNSRDTVHAGLYARQRGARVVAVTTNPESGVAEVADLVLPIFSPSVQADSADFSGRVAGLALLEAIVTAVSWARDEVDHNDLNDLWAAQTRWNTLPDGWKPR